VADDNGTIHGTSDGGVAGKHPEADPFEFLVGPTTGDEFNTTQLRLVPVACFRVDDVRFDFDSSFVTADPADEKKDIRAELKLLVELLKDHPQSPLSVFGHADPVGSDDYNKLLSGRRATVIYALLISTTDPDAAVKLWKTVAATENWGAPQRTTMQSFTGLPAGTADNDLFKAYMQKLAPPELKVSKQDFLAQLPVKRQILTIHARALPEIREPGKARFRSADIPARTVKDPRRIRCETISRWSWSCGS